MKQDTLAGELEQLAEKAFKPNPLEWYLPWRVIAESGKPTIAGSKSGNLFRGFIGTWQDADLVVALVNNLPTILAALRTDGEANSRAVPSGEAVERAECEHDWHYTGTDYHGSHKDEDHYRCRKCPAWQYRLDDRVIATVVPKPAASASKPDDASALLKEAYRQGWQDCAEDVLTATHKDAMNEGAQNYLDASIGRDGA